MLRLACRLSARQLRRPCTHNICLGKRRSTFTIPASKLSHQYGRKRLLGRFRTITDEAKQKEPTGIAKHKWPIIISTVIASIVGYFWKGRLESKDLEALQERLDVRVVGKSCKHHHSIFSHLPQYKFPRCLSLRTAPREIKDLRLDNNIRLGQTLHTQAIDTIRDLVIAQTYFSTGGQRMGM